MLLESVVHIEYHKASKSVKGTQCLSLGVSMVFLGWFKVVWKDFKIVVSKEFKVIYFSCECPDYIFSRIFSCDEQLKK